MDTPFVTGGLLRLHKKWD